MQSLLVFLIVAAAVGYACWRISKAISTAQDPCAGCAGCPLKDAKSKNKKCNKKKQPEKFGRNEKKH